VDELSPAARRLIDRATAEDEPPKHEIDESWGMVVSRVESSRSRERPRAILVLAALGAAVLLGLGLWFSVTPTRERVSVVLVPDVRTSRADAEPPPALHPVVDTSRASDGAGLLDEAEASLADDPPRAWTLLLRHAEISSDTASVPRRLALRIRTLCALGRMDEAIHETTAFLHRHGDTPHAEDVRAACGMQGVED
jgi:hypothetical protein